MIIVIYLIPLIIQNHFVVKDLFKYFIYIQRGQSLDQSITGISYILQNYDDKLYDDKEENNLCILGYNDTYIINFQLFNKFNRNSKKEYIIYKI